MSNPIKRAYAACSRLSVSLVDRAKMTEHTFMIIVAIIIGVLAGFGAILIRSLIKELGSERTVILSSHILPEVLATCDRIIIIHRGQLVANGTPEQLQREQMSNPPVILRLQAGESTTEEKVLGMLRAQNWVESSKARPVGSHGELEFELRGKGDADLRSRAVTLASEQKWDLLEVRRELLDLEGLFRKLTQE